MIYTLAFLLLLGAASLVASVRFRQQHYETGVGVQYPYWNEPILSNVGEEVKWTKANCSDVKDYSLNCELFQKAGTRNQSSNEAHIIRRLTSKDRSSDYCDRFYGPCAPQKANISLRDASEIFYYLDVMYLQQAKEDLERGRMRIAHSLVSRVRYLLGGVDLPLGSQGCCRSMAELYLIPAFLSDQNRWRDREYVAAVFELGTSQGEAEEPEAQRFNDLTAWKRASAAAHAGCYRAASDEYKSLAGVDERRPVREMAAYMAIVSGFRDQLYGDKKCKGIQPKTAWADLLSLKTLISRQSLVTDVQQIETDLAARGLVGC
jgi:hypothetical protein